MVSINTRQSYPASRPRRLRQKPWLRGMVAETQLSPNDLIWAVIIQDSEERREAIPSMPGVLRFNIDALVEAAEEAAGLGIPALALFPYVNPAKKDELGKEAYNPNGIIPRAIKAVKEAVPSIGVICDVALDPYTTHGHDGLIDASGYVQNDPTIEILCRQAIMQAKAGADIVAPSDMMDGRVGAIRKALDGAGFHRTLILSYAAKYASAFYGPYRDAIGSAKALKGDKRTYQQDPANSDEALREVAMDIDEGADMVMVKPGLPYLDIIHRVSTTFPVPCLAFQVSGEYAQILAAGERGWIDDERAMVESLTCLKRAGASAIITYFAPRMAAKLVD